jgi:hypothetical protein
MHLTASDVGTELCASATIPHYNFRPFLEQAAAELTTFSMQSTTTLFFDNPDFIYPEKILYNKTLLYYRDYLQDQRKISLFDERYDHILQLIFFSWNKQAEFVGSPIMLNADGNPVQSLPEISAMLKKFPPFVIHEWTWAKL